MMRPRTDMPIAVIALWLALAGPAGAAPPDVELPDLSGTPRSLAEFEGRILAVNFWATWCAPCLEEIPELVRLQREFGDRGLQWVGVAVEDDVEAVRAFAGKAGVNYPTLIGEDEALALARDLGNQVAAMPYTVIFDRAGQVVFVRKGTVRFDEVVEVIEPLLEGP